MTEADRKDAQPTPRGRRSLRPRATELDVFVGARLRQARTESGVTQEALGKAMGVSFQAIQKYESGENRLSVGRLAKAARLLNRPYTYFLPGFDVIAAIEHGQPPPLAASLSDQEIELLQSYRMIRRPEVRRNLLALTRQFTELDKPEQ